MPAFEELTREMLREMYDRSPTLASALGLTEYDDRLDDVSEAAFEQHRERNAHWRTTFEGLADSDLSADERIDRDLILSTLRGEAIMDDWRMWRRQPATYLNPGLNGVFSLFLHRLRPDADLARSAAARLRAVPGNIADGKKNLRADLAPSVYIERGIGQARAAVRYARELVPAEVLDSGLQGELAEAGAVAADAFEEFAVFLEELKGRATGEWAIGEERYSRLLTEKEALGFGARELRERGRAEYDRVAEEMARVAHEIDPDADWRAVLARLNQDHAPSPEAMRDTYIAWTERARQFLKVKRLVTFPEGERCEVDPSPPFQRPILAVASYQTPPPFSSVKTGHFFVPFPPDGAPAAEIQKRLESNSNGAIPTIAVHEAYPGHHWHLSLAGENPRAVRHVFRTAYFAEGWALYAERVMREQGFFDDPRRLLYHLDATIFRAARIIVDTSLHMGEMSEQEAVRFMMERANLPEPTARAEVGRYCSWPTQASSYLTGCLEILRIRDRYMREKGADGIDSLRAFHDTLCAAGSLPIALAERAVMGE